MADGRGAKSKVAISKGTVWGTATLAAANDGLLVESSSASGGKEVLDDRALSGKVSGNKPIIGQEIHRVPLDMKFRYGARCATIIAGIMGTAGAPSEVEAALEYTHECTFEDRLGDFFTLIEQKGDVKPWEYASAKMTRLEIEVGGRGPGTLSCEFIACGVDTTNSSTNTTTTMASVTVTDVLNPVFLGDCRVEINSSGYLGLTDIIKPDRVRISVDRKLSEDFKADSVLGKFVSEPVETEDVEITLSFEFPEYAATTWRDAVDSGTEYKCEVLFSGPDLAGAASSEEWEHKFEFPSLVGMARPDNQMSGPERIRDSITFKCLEAATAVSGITNTDPFTYTHRNQANVNLLT